MKPHKIEIIDHGICIEHDHACPVCATRNSVYFMNTGVFEPCWECQKLGYITIKAPKLLKRFLKRYRE